VSFASLSILPPVAHPFPALLEGFCFKRIIAPLSYARACRLHLVRARNLQFRSRVIKTLNLNGWPVAPPNRRLSFSSCTGYLQLIQLDPLCFFPPVPTPFASSLVFIPSLAASCRAATSFFFFNFLSLHLPYRFLLSSVFLSLSLSCFLFSCSFSFVSYRYFLCARRTISCTRHGRVCLLVSLFQRLSLSSK